MAANGAESRCELCERKVSLLTKHHLIPRTRHKNRRNKKRFDRAEVRRRIAWLCRPCHKQIHSLLDEKQLEHRFNTIAELAREPSVAKFVAWIRDKPDGISVPSLLPVDRRRATRKTLRRN